MFSIYAMDSHNRHCRFAGVRFIHSASSRICFLLAFELAVHKTFDVYDVRKIYMDVPDWNFSPLKGLVSRQVLRHEATLVEYRYFQGRYWDQHILSMTPQSLERLSAMNAELGIL